VSGERTEKATPKRLGELRSEGRIARSPELGPAVALLVGSIVLQMSVGGAAQQILGLLTGNLTQVASTGPSHDPDVLWAQQAVGMAGQAWLLSVAPLIVVLPLLGIGIGFAQGAVFTTKSLFKFSNLNPMHGVQRLWSLQSLVGLGRSLLKVALIGLMFWRALDETIRLLPTIDGSTDPRLMATFIGQTMLNLVLSGGEVLIALAIADYAYQRWSFTRSTKMSKQEVKEEGKQAEGDPIVRSQMRQRMRKMAQSRRQLQDVPKATVVVTNPTHIAVALQYERGMASPKVVAMGADLIAEQIKKLAREAGVPCVENVPLARGLYASVEVGQEIPVELYQAVAEVLAYVFSLRSRRRRTA
jgi:flagellar biosynthesis protein FlhB